MKAARAASPARQLALLFAAGIGLGTAGLMLPAARAGQGGAGFVEALFTATSAVCVTGLTIVDTGTYWSGFGQLLILLMLQLGGFGIVTSAALLSLLLFRKLGLRSRMMTQDATGSDALGGLGSLMMRIIAVTLVVEIVCAGVLAARFLSLGMPTGHALWSAAFHAVSAFNHGGFSLYPDSLTAFVFDEWVTLPLVATVVLSSLGFPVLLELLRDRGWRPRSWTLHARLTILTSAVLLGAGLVAFAALEWSNARTLGSMSVTDKLLTGLFQSAMPRSAGFNTVDHGATEPATQLVTSILMFIGGGSVSTAGGIRVATFALIALVLLAEARSSRDVIGFGRRISMRLLRQAIAVSLLAIGLVMAGTIGLLILSDLQLGAALFEAVSASSTVGLSTGVTADLPAPAQLLLVLLMYAGRLGPLTFAAVLVYRQAPAQFRLPQERVLIG